MKIKILIVDDDRDLLNLVEKYLMRKHPDLEVVSAITAQDALRFIEEDEFDAIVCDFYLGSNQMNGLELLEWLRGASNNIPFVMFTGRSREEVAIRALNLGADFYLKKDEHDFEGLFTELIHHLRRAVEQRQMEVALSRSESRYRTLFDDSPISLWEQDLSHIRKMMDDKKEEGVSDFREYFEKNPDFLVECIKEIRIVSVNRNTLDLFGVPDFDTLDSRIFNDLVEESYSVFQEVFAVFYEGERFFQGEISAKNLSGHIVKLEFGAFIARGYEQDWSRVLVALTDITDKLASQKALKESEERYRTVFEDAPIAMTITDFDGQFISCNNYMFELTGYSWDELKHIHVTTLYRSPEKRDEKLSMLRKSGYLRNFQVELKRKDETCFFAVLNEEIIQIDDRIQILSTIRDITSLVQAENSLRESEQQYRNTLFSLSDAIHVIDSDFKIILMNPGSELWLSELNIDTNIVGMNLFEAFPFLPDNVREEYDQVFENATPVSTIETTLIGDLKITTETKKIPIVREGEVVQVVTVLRDITEWMKFETSLKQSQENLQVAFDSMDDFLFIVSMDGKIIETNEVVRSRLGYSKEELTGENVLITHPKEQREVAARILMEIIEGVTTICPIPYQTKDGTIIPVETRITHGTWDGASVLIGVSRDVTERKKAEDALRFTQFAIDHTSEPAYWMGVDARFIYVNEAACNSLGYTREELLSLTVHDIDPVFTKDRWSSHWSDLREQKSFTVESIHRRKDGIEFPVEITVNYVEFEGKEYNCAFARNLSEQVRAIEELKESEQRHRMLVESMQDLIFIFDSANHHSAYYAPSDHLLYLPPEEFLGKPISETLPKDVADALEEVSIRVRSTGVSEPLIYSLKIDNQLRWFEATLSLHEDGESIVSFVRDITERYRIESQIEEQRDFLEKVIESLTHPFYVIDASNYSIILANKSARLGSSDLQTKCYEVTHNSNEPCHLAEVPCPLEEVKSTKKPTTVEHIHTDKDGYARAYLVHGFPIINENGDVVQMIEYNLDVTEQRSAYRELQQQREELSTFAHQMSHDLNNYLLKIDGEVKMLEVDHESKSTKTIQRLISEVRDLLQHSIALADAGLVIEKKDPVNLDIFVKKVAEGHIPVGIDYSQDSLPIVMADQTKLLQVFQNLFDNAVKHGKPSSIEVRYGESKKYTIIIVSNDGAPIPGELRTKILSRWLGSKTDRSGFGLSIVRRIVEAHGWIIELADSDHTQFSINIPKSEIVESLDK